MSAYQDAIAGSVKGKLVEQELYNLLDTHPGLAAILVETPIIRSDRTKIASTDGHNIYLGPGFFAWEDIRERHFGLTHESFHKLMGHPLRGKLLKEELGDRFDHHTFNIAGDAMINFSIEIINDPQIFKTPANLVDIRKFEHELGRNDLTTLTVEELYFLFMKSPDAVKRAMGGGQAGQSDEDGDGCPGCDGIEIPGNDPGLTPGEQRAKDEKALAKAQAAYERACGYEPALDKLRLSAFPPASIPWQKVLCNYLSVHAKTKKRTNPAVPHRRWNALEYTMRKFEGVTLPMYPGHFPHKRGRIALCLDTSGSVSEAMLTTFLGEITGVLRTTDCLVGLIECDAETHSDGTQHEILELSGEEGARKLLEYVIIGRGGTDFRPAIELAVDWKADAIVYFTDLDGPAGDAPRCPVLWAVPAMCGKSKPPYGQLLTIK